MKKGNNPRETERENRSESDTKSDEEKRGGSKPKAPNMKGTQAVRGVFQKWKD